MLSSKISRQHISALLRPEFARECAIKNFRKNTDARLARRPGLYAKTPKINITSPNFRLSFSRNSIACLSYTKSNKKKTHAFRKEKRYTYTRGGSNARIRSSESIALAFWSFWILCLREPIYPRARLAAFRADGETPHRKSGEREEVTGILVDVLASGSLQVRLLPAT